MEGVTGLNVVRRLKSLLFERQTLSHRTIQGSFWMGGVQIVGRLVGWVTSIILMRLLAPSDFGLIAIVTLVVNTLEAISQTGLRSAVVQMKEKGTEYLDTTWTVDLLRSVGIVLLIFASAPLVARFYEEPRLTALLWAVGASRIMTGLINVGSLYFFKDLQFGKQFIMQAGAILVRAVIVIPLAFVLRNVWVLVVSAVIPPIFKCIVSYVLHPYRPRFALDRQKARRLFDFGRWMLGLQLLKIATDMGDNALVGKVLGMESLGYYRSAYNLGNEPASQVYSITSKVLFPAYAKIQDESERLRRGYLRVLELVLFIIVPLAAGLYLVGPTFIRVVLPERWLPVIPPLLVLVVAGFLKAVVETGHPMLRGVGKPNIEFAIKIIQVAVMFGLLYPLTSWHDTVGAAWAVLLSFIVVLPLWFVVSMRLARLTLRDYLRAFGPPGMAALLMSLTLIAILRAVPENVYALVGLIAGGGMIYVAISFTLWRLFRLGALAHIAALMREV